MFVDTFAVGPLGCNCSIVADATTKEAIVIDPGGDLDLIQHKLQQHHFVTRAIVHTHTHIDHVGVTADLQKKTNAAARIHQADHFLYSILPVQAQLLGMRSVPTFCEFDRWLYDDELIELGSLRVRVIHTPGHTPGSCSFELCSVNQSESSMLFTGDTLFQHSVGRTDLWGGDHDALVRSIQQKLFALPDATRVVCGHGDETTIGDEKRVNPFVRVENTKIYSNL